MDIKKAFIIYKNEGPDVLVNILLQEGINFKEINRIIKEVEDLDKDGYCVNSIINGSFDIWYELMKLKKFGYITSTDGIMIYKERK